jgi:hypothetical protein
MTGDKLGNDAARASSTMVRTNDGFEIAKTDLRLRGPGDLMGTQQSGLPELHIADLVAMGKDRVNRSPCKRGIAKLRIPGAAVPDPVHGPRHPPRSTVDRQRRAASPPATPISRACGTGPTPARCPRP